MRIAVCDDNKVVLDSVALSINGYIEENKLSGTVKTFLSAERLLEMHSSEPFDIIFLDIIMPGLSGFELAERLDDNIPIVFVTSCDNMVYDSIQYRPFAFIRKNQYDKMNDDIQKAMSKIISHLKQTKVISIDVGYGEIADMMVKNIVFVKSSGHYLEWYLKDNTILRCHAKFSDYEEQFKEYDFIRIHRCFYVNMRSITLFDIRNEEVTLNGCIKLDISRSLKDAVHDKYRAFLKANS